MVIGLDLPKGQKRISVGSIFKDGTKVREFTSNQIVTVTNGFIEIDTPNTILLIEKK